MFNLFAINLESGEYYDLGHYSTTLEMEDAIDTFDTVYSPMCREAGPCPDGPIPSINADECVIWYEDEAESTYEYDGYWRMV